MPLGKFITSTSLLLVLCCGNLLLHNEQELVIIREGILQFGDSRVRKLTMHLKLLHCPGLLFGYLCGDDLGNELSIGRDLLTFAQVSKLSPVWTHKSIQSL